MKSWNHASSKSRKNAGLPLEKQFREEFSCGCGGRLVRPDHYWECDYECEDCGNRFEIKSASERTGNIAISQKAWESYSDETMIVSADGHYWYAADKQTITNTCNCIHDARSSTHPETGGYGNGAYDSSFYLIPLSSLNVLDRKG